MTRRSPTHVIEDRVRRGYARLGFAWSVGLLLIAVQTGIRIWQVAPGAWWQDDFVILRMARELGLSPDLLFTSYNSNLQPGVFLASWLATLVPGSYYPAAAFVIVVQLVTSVLMLVLLHTVARGRPVAVVGLAVYLFTPLMVPSVTWWASFGLTVPVQLGMALSGWCLLRLMRGGSWRWLLGIAGALLLAMFFTQKAVVVPVFLVIVALLADEGGARHVLRRLLRLWSVWLLTGALTSAYLLLYRDLAEVGGSSVTGVWPYLQLAWNQVVNTFLVGIFGGPWRGSGFGAQWGTAGVAARMVLVQLGVAVVVLAWWWRGWRSLLGWAALLGFLLVDVSITALGRGVWGSLIGTDPRYLVDAIPVAAFVVTTMALPARPATQSLDLWMRRRPRLLAVAAVLVLFNSSMITVGAVVKPFQRPEVNSYVDNVRVQLARNPDLALYDGAVPPALMLPLFDEQDRQLSEVLKAFDLRPRFNVTSENLRVLDEAGISWPIAVVFAGQAKIRGVRDCGVALKSDRPRTLRLDKRLGQGPWVMRVTYFTSKDGVVQATVAGQTHEFGVRRGSRSVYVVVDGPVASVDLALDRSDGLVCINSLLVGFPVPEKP